MWSNVVMGQEQQQQNNSSTQEGVTNASSEPTKVIEPGGRYKHAITLANDDLYMYGGKAGHATLKDFWKLQLRGGSWTQIHPNPSNKIGQPPPLQEHSLVHHNGCLYLFGGQIGLTDTNSVPLWIYNIKNNEWRKWEGCDGAKSVPAGGRRGHVATIHSAHMLIHGGYRDLMGSLGDLWAFHFETESWHLFHNHSTPAWYSLNNNGPLPRHNHGGITHAGSLYVIGGMHNLDEKSDFWKYDLKTRRWTQLKTKPMPGPLKSPSITKALGSLFVLGGDRNGRPTDEFWRFSFETEVWERITIHGLKPSPRQFPAVVMLPALIKIKTGTLDSALTQNCKTNGKFFDDDDERSSSPNNYWWDYGPKNNGHNSNFTNKLTHSTCVLVDSGVPNYQMIGDHHVEQCGISADYEEEHSRVKPRRSESAYCMNSGGQPSSLGDKCRVKKSNSVRFNDQTITIGNSRTLPTSDYSSMETIGEQRIISSSTTTGFENPNYRGRPARPATIANLSDHQHPATRGGRGYRISPRGGGGVGLIGDLIEMDEFGEDQQLLTNPLQEQHYEVTTPNYLLMIGGLETSSGLNNQLLGKKPLAIWRLRVSQELFH